MLNTDELIELKWLRGEDIPTSTVSKCNVIKGVRFSLRAGNKGKRDGGM